MQSGERRQRFDRDHVAEPCSDFAAAGLGADLAECFCWSFPSNVTTSPGASLWGEDSHASIRNAVSAWRTLRQSVVCSVPGGICLARSRKRPACSARRWARVVVCLKRRRRFTMVFPRRPLMSIAEILTGCAAARANLGESPSCSRFLQQAQGLHGLCAMYRRRRNRGCAALMVVPSGPRRQAGRNLWNQCCAPTFCDE